MIKRQMKRGVIFPTEGILSSALYLKPLAISIAVVCASNLISQGMIGYTKTSKESSIIELPEEYSVISGMPSVGVSELLSAISITTVASNLGAKSSESIKIEVEKHRDSNIGYTTDLLCVRSGPSVKSEKIGVLSSNKEVSYKEYDDGWYTVSFKGETGFVSKDYITDICPYKSLAVYGDTRKSFMDYKTITNKNSLQYKMQKEAYTDNYGIRIVDNRYCIAVGSYYSSTVGQYIDVVLSNGEVLPCIVGDCKDDKHTNISHTLGAYFWIRGTILFINCSCIVILGTPPILTH